MDKLYEFLNKVMDRSGVRPIIAGGAIFGMYYMAWYGVTTGEIAVGGSLIIFLILSIFRHFEKRKEQ